MRVGYEQGATRFQSSLFAGTNDPVDCVIRGFDTCISMRKIAAPVRIGLAISSCTGKVSTFGFRMIQRAVLLNCRSRFRHAPQRKPQRCSRLSNHGLNCSITLALPTSITLHPSSQTPTRARHAGSFATQLAPIKSYTIYPPFLLSQF